MSWISIVTRTISYLLVFYAGLEIGVTQGKAGISPIIAILCAVIFGAVARASREA